MHAARRGGKSRRRQASLNGVVVSNVLCSRTVDTSNRSLNEIMMFVQSIFRSVWSKVRRRLKKAAFGLNKGKELLSCTKLRHFV